ncbi:MAG: hypothetical protein ABFD96_18930, partial [Armatimonadia bacterium]
IPRMPPNHETNALCPIHGEKVREKNAWTAWTTDPIGHPYKVRCRYGGEWYPSNDFMNGDLTSGEFPDDGSGCKYQGKTYHFLKEYAHMAYGNNTIPCLRSLSQAWLLTGDKQYARKGCILLARLATEYPNFTDRKDRLLYGPYGGRDPHYTWKTGGMITDFIWESFCLEATAYAYDGLYNYTRTRNSLPSCRARGCPSRTAATCGGTSRTISSASACRRCSTGTSRATRASTRPPPCPWPSCWTITATLTPTRETW